MTISLKRVTPRNSLHALIISISDGLSESRGAESMRKKSFSRWRDGTKACASSIVLSQDFKKLRMSGSHRIGERWGSGVDTSVKIDRLMPATSCSHEIAMLANLFWMPSDLRQVRSAKTWEMPFSTVRLRIPIPA